MGGFSVSLDERDRPGRLRRRLVQWWRGRKPAEGYWESRFLEADIERLELLEEVKRLRASLTWIAGKSGDGETAAEMAFLTLYGAEKTK